MYGVGAVKYKDFVVGYIEKNSFDMGCLLYTSDAADEL